MSWVRIFRSCPRAFNNNVSSGSRRFFRHIISADCKIMKPFDLHLHNARYISQEANITKHLVGQRGTVKDTILRGQAATNVQESFLREFIEEQEEASPEEWQSLLKKIFQLQHGMIHEVNIDGRILEMCHVAGKLPLARSYMNFIKSSGKKFNSVTVCGFIKVCHDCRKIMTPDDRLRVQVFTKYLLTKHKILDMIVGDAVIKGLILCGMGDKSLQVLEDMGKMNAIPSTSYAAVASFFIDKKNANRAIEYFRLFMYRNPISHHGIFIDYIEQFKDDPQELNKLLMFFREFDVKPSKTICDALVTVFQALPGASKLEGVYGIVNNSGECSVCNRRLQRLDLLEDEFLEMRAAFLNLAMVGNDVFQNTTPAELRKFITFVEKNAPFDIVLDGLNVAYMTGTCVTPEVYVGLIKGVIQHFQERDNKILLIGRNHMKRWTNLLFLLNECQVDYFFIEDISVDDPFIIYSTLYSGLNSCFVTRDLLRSEKYKLSEEQHALFKRWQQSHQIFITYVAPSGKVYAKTPISFQMMLQRTSSGGWHIPYSDGSEVGSSTKEDYSIHRKWLCLDRYLT